MLLKEIVDALSIGNAGERLGAINHTLLLIGAVLVVQSFFSYIETYYKDWVGERLAIDMRNRCFRKLLHVPMKYFHYHPASELSARLSDDITSVQRIVTNHFIFLLRNGLTATGVLVLLIVLDPSLTLFSFVSVAVIAIGGTFALNAIKKVSKLVQDKRSKLISFIFEALRNMLVIKSFSQEDNIYKQYDSKADELFTYIVRRNVKLALVIPVTNLIAFGTVGVVIWLALQKVASGTMDAGQLVQYFSYAFLLAASFSQVSSHLGSIKKEEGAMARILSLISEKNESTETLVAPDVSELEGEIVFHNVRFAYGETATPVFQNLSLSIQPGTTVACVGPSGAGKTTLTHLLMKTYEPQEGDISIDGLSLRELPHQWLRRQIGVVLQEPYLFHTTIRENIRFGRLDATDEEVQFVAKQANIDEFVQQLPQKYETVVGEGHTNISRGQAQRIAIARMLLKDPRIVILDEATSSLDSENEHLVQEALHKLTRGRTTIVIAHRLSSIKYVDHIFVLFEGDVVEQGTFNELIRREGFFYKIYNLQTNLLPAEVEN